MLTARKYTGIFVLIITLFFIPTDTIKAQVTNTEIKSTFILHFCENVIWDKKPKNEIIIGCYTENREIYQILNSARRAVKIQGLNYSVRMISSLEQADSCHALYYSGSDQLILTSILKLAREKNILLITDNYPDQLFVMINLIDEEDRVTFKINMPNLSLAGFSVRPNILLNGGSVVDIKTAYEKFEDQLQESIRELERNEAILAEKDSIIKQKETEIERYLEEVSFYQTESETLKFRVREETQRLQLKTDEVNSKDRELNRIYDDISQRQQELDRLKKDLLVLQSASDTLKTEIDRKNLTLNEKEVQISNRNKIIILFLVFISTLIAGTVITLRLFYINRKQNQKLEVANNELHNTNTMLEEQKGRLNMALEELKLAQMQMIQSEKMASLGIMTAGVAHEINNPLNYIQTGLYAMEEYIMDDKRIPEDVVQNISDIMDKMDTGVNRASNIVRSLNTFSRKDTGTIREFDLHEMLDTIFLILKHETKDKCNIVKHYDKDLTRIEGNNENLNQVFFNIIMNGLQAIKKNGEITIATRKQENHVEISVRDNGEGISEENMKKIFDPFFTTKDPGKGVGLGLSICYKIIKEHNGSIKYYSKPGKGTEVFINLPLRLKTVK